MTSKQTETNIQSIQELLTELRALGIQLWLENDQLRYKAPKNALTPEKLSQLKTHKSEILAFLRQSESSSKSKSESPSITPRENQGSIPLSFAQQRLWFLDQLEPNSPFYNIATAVRLSGHLDHQALQRALNTIVERHEVLRTTYTADNGNPVQVINPPQTVEFLTIDLQEYEGREQESKLQNTLKQECETPFNLATDLMIRGCLVQLTETEQVLLIVMHHIASDGWSMGVLWKEIGQLYEAFIENKTNPLPTLPIQYADYAVWQKEWLSGEVLEKQLNYWKEQLESATPVLELPTDQPRPGIQTYRGASQDITVSRKLTEDIKALCQQEGVTVYMTLLAAFQTLLYRYTLQEDIIVGSPFAGRNREEVEGLIGFFVNTLVCRANFSQEQSFLSLLIKVREATFGTFANQDMPFEKLVEELRIKRDTSRHPLFQVWFNMVNLEDVPLKLSGIDIAPVEIEEPASKFDLTLYVVEEENTLTFRLVYNPDLFSSERMQEMLHQYRYLLEQIIKNPEISISELSMVSPEAKFLLPDPEHILSVPDQIPVPISVSQWAVKQPNRVAITQGEQSWTYEELVNQAKKIAQILLQQGIQPGTVVGVRGNRSFGLIASLLGVFMSGGTLLTLDPKLPIVRQQLMLEVSQAKILIVIGSETNLGDYLDSQISNMVVSPDSANILDIEEILQEEIIFDVPVLLPDQPAYVFFTSGTTGTPKGVLGNHKGLAHFLNWQRETFAVSPQDKVAQLTGLSFDVVLRDIFLALTSGATLCLPLPKDDGLPALILPWLERQQITILHLVPSLAKTWLVNAPQNQSLKDLRLVFFAGEPLSSELVQQWRQAWSNTATIVNLYGPTETTLAKCYQQVENPPLPGIQPVGRPLPNTQALVLSQNQQLCGIGETGEIVLRTPFRTHGYINNPEKQQQLFRPNPSRNDEQDLLYYTGDLGRYRPDGVLDILGRRDHQVKIRGVRIELGEIEAVLSQNSAIAQSIVIAREDYQGNKSLVAYVISSSETQLTTNELRQFLQERLPVYMIPNAFVYLDAIPLTPNGKVDRKALPQPDLSKSSVEADFVLPTNQLEEALSVIWTKAIGIEKISIHDNFFDLGGHSLLAIQVISRCRQAFSVEIPLQALFDNPTVAALAQKVLQLQNNEPAEQQNSSIRPRKEQATIPLSFAQQRLWFLDQLEPNSPFYNIATAVRLSGHLNHQALQKALNTIVERHEVLRTTYTADNGNPVQVINPPQTVEFLTINLQQYQDKEQEIQLQTILNRESQRPFNLSSDLMLRGCLLQLADDEYVLLLVMHHIASDGWSIGILWNELETLYKASVEEKAGRLPTLPIQYADYAVWQRNWLSGEVLEKQLNYWKTQLADANPVLELPTDRSRPVVQSYRGARHFFALSKNVTQKIQALSRQEGVTLYMLLLATFQVLLYRYTRQEDIIVGSPIAGRNREEIEGLIGFFVNTLVFRTDLAGNPSFKEVLNRVKAKTMEAYAHQDLPFDRLVEEISPERSLSYNPLFQVMFVLHNTFTQTEMWSGLKKSPVEMDKDTAKFDLTLSMSEEDGRLIGQWEYSTDLFDGSTIERMAGHFGTLLEGIVANPNECIASLPLLSPKELHQILIEWNDTATDYPKDQCVHQLFEAQAERTPEAIALCFEQQQLTYRQLNERANQLAHYLLSLNLDPQVLIGICVERSLEAIIGFLGILKAGGIYVPIDPAYPPERIALIIEDTQVPVLLTQETLGKNLPQHSGNTIYLDRDWGKINTSSTGNLACRTTPEDLAYIMYTSGSTGRPKGVCVRHKGIVRLVQNTNYADFSSEQIFLQLAPVSFDAATFEIWGALLNGARLILFPSRVPSLEELGQAIKQYQVTILWLTSGLFHLMVDEKLEDLASLQQLLAGGDVLSVTHIRKFLKEVDGCKLINGYGPTENTTFTCCHLIDSLEENCQSVPIGKPIANTQVYLLDKYFNPVPTGVVGELYTGGDGLATGYFQRPDLTKDKFIDNPLKKSSFANLDGANYSDRLYKTGDLARYLPDGTIEFLGRIDNQVKIRGFRIELGEIEGIIAEHPSVKQSIVLVREKSPGDKYIVAYVVCQSQQSSVDPQKLSDFIKEKLPNYMVPAAIVLLDEFPLTPNGKIDRRALPEPDFVKSNLSTNFVAPQTPLEQQIADIWVKALNINQVGIHDNFFELGGHSLLAVQVFSEIEKTWNTKLPLSILFNAPSIHELAKAIQNQDQSSSPASSIVAIQPKGKKTPVFGIHAIGTSVQFYRGLAEYLGEDQPFYGLQSRFLDYASPDLTLEDMAAIYIEDIKTIQAEGPYLLTGYSFGGRVVYEMAQQLMKSDIEVALLAIIDAPAPGGFQRLPWNEYLVEHWKNLRAFGIDYAVRKISTQFNLRTLQLRKFINKRDQSKKADTNTAEFFKNRLRQIEALHQQVLDNYQFKEYPGTVTLFKSDTKPDNVGDKWEPTLGWQYFAKGGVEIHDIPGTHRNIFNEPNVQIFAKKFSSCINKALEK